MWQKVSSIYRKSLSSYGQQQKKQINRKLSKRFVYISDEIHSLLFSFHNFVVVLLVICCCCCCQQKKQEKKKQKKRRKYFVTICAFCLFVQNAERWTIIKRIRPHGRWAASATTSARARGVCLSQQHKRWNPVKGTTWNSYCGLGK